MASILHYLVVVVVALYLSASVESCNSKPSKADQCKNILNLSRRKRDLFTSADWSSEETDSSHSPLNRTKRFSHNWMRDTPCDELQLEYHNQYLQLDPDVFLNPNHPITHVGYKNVVLRYGTPPIRVITHIEAEPHPGLLPCDRTNFGSEFDPRMTALGARRNLGRGRNDEKGHIIASQICGPIAWYNLAPQTPEVNRNVRNAGVYGWINLENEIARWVNQGCGRVEVEVYLNYAQLASTRPKGFKMCIAFKDLDNNVLRDNSRYFENGQDDRFNDDEDPSDEL
ncbi:unnamed protein product [Orchesella dallaii]|uniref:Type VII secretion system protein EssD-like domain-containing protein n=1 Tax=Orchesella dallaii TaxID=48710 RepID=A0ABP1SA45_9HEXA